jgi:hypothetical protein
MMSIVETTADALTWNALTWNVLTAKRPGLNNELPPERFPHAKAVATPAVVKAMQARLSPELVDSFWRKRFPGQIPDWLVAAEPLTGEGLELEGRKLVVVNTGKADTADTTSFLSRPSD